MVLVCKIDKNKKSESIKLLVTMRIEVYKKVSHGGRGEFVQYNYSINSFEKYPLKAIDEQLIYDIIMAIRMKDLTKFEFLSCYTLMQKYK